MSTPTRRRRVLFGGTKYPNIAAQFVAVSTQYASIADNAAFSTGDIDFSGCVWVKSNSFGADRTIMAKADNGLIEYVCRYDNASSRYRFFVSTDGVAVVGNVLANNFGAPGTGQWHFLVWTHDSVANQTSISVNAGTADTAAAATGPVDRAGPFTIGGRVITTPQATWDGLIDCAGFWKRVLTADDIVKLYKGGVGMAYRDLDSGLKTSLVDYFDFDNSLVGKHAGTVLANNNGITFASGKR